MKLSYVSSQSISKALRYSLQRMQTELVAGQKEVQTGKVADAGLALGIRSGQVVSLARDVERLGTIVDSNTLASSRMSAAQNALGQIGEAANTFLSALTAAVSGDADQGTTRQAASVMLASLTGIVNSAFNGEHVFAGVNTDVQPLADYSGASGSAAKAAFDAAFFAEFGMTQTDPGVVDIAGSDLKAFFDGAVNDQFLGDSWKENWSSATDKGILTRIALNETAETSVSANTSGVRKLAMAATIVADLYNGPLNETARIAVAETATRLVGEAMGDISQEQARLGFTEQRVTRASERLKTQISVFDSFRSDLEGVDPYEASTRVNALITQIETSYALTARIQQLSLTRLLT